MIRLRLRRALGIAGLLALGIATGCGVPEEGPRLVLLYATCTLDRNHLTPYAPGRPITPALARFAEDAAVLMRHHTESGQSGVAYASILSGLQAPGHGVYFHPRPLDEDVDLIGEHFTRAGWESHSWLDHEMADESLGYAQGIPEHARHERFLHARAPAFVDLLDRLAEDESLQAFVVTNFTVTHSPYDARALPSFCRRHPERCEALEIPAFGHWRELYERHHLDLSWDFPGTAAKMELTPEHVERLEAVVALLYEANVANLDRLFGQVIDAIEARGLLEESVVVFTADHGEIGVRDNAAFRWTHGMQLAPEVLQVPALIHAPASGVRPGPYPAVSRSVDLLPTLLGLAGLPVPEDTEGIDLSAALRAEVPPPRLTAWMHTALLAPEYRARRLPRAPRLAARFPRLDPGLIWVAARRGDAFFELRREGDETHRPRLYRLDRDPEKRHDRFDPANPDHRAMQGDLVEYLAELEAAYPGDYGPESSAEELERLRSLGYVE